MADMLPQGDIVLIVDDSPETLSFLHDALAGAGMGALVATSGSAALLSLEHIVPDVILMDALMPEMDGFATCRHIKANPAMCDVPIIFMTGLSDPEHVLKGFSSGGIDYVTKPIDSDVLIARIRAHLAVSRLARDARKTLDSTGQHVIAARRDGKILWATPMARNLCDRCEPYSTSMLPRAAVEMLQQVNPVATRAPSQWLAVSETMELKIAGITPADDVMLLVRERRSTNPSEALRNAFEITRREADVLLWICRGKTNRDIAEILSMSPRTVDKHLEQVYAKLGVENRTSAARVGLAILERSE